MLLLFFSNQRSFFDSLGPACFIPARWPPHADLVSAFSHSDTISIFSLSFKGKRIFTQWNLFYAAMETNDRFFEVLPVDIWRTIFSFLDINFTYKCACSPVFIRASRHTNSAALFFFFLTLFKIFARLQACKSLLPCISLDFWVSRTLDSRAGDDSTYAR